MFEPAFSLKSLDITEQYTSVVLDPCGFPLVPTQEGQVFRTSSELFLARYSVITYSLAKTFHFFNSLWIETEKKNCYKKGLLGHCMLDSFKIFTFKHQ